MRGDDQARFDAIFREHFDAVLRFALARMEPEAAKDVAAETLLVAWHDLDRLPAAPRGWLLGVTRHKIADYYRSAEHSAKLTAKAAEAMPWAQPDPSDRIVEQDHLNAALARLRAADREVLQLIAWDELSYREAAAVLGCTTTSFAVRLHRARRKLREALEGQETPQSATASQPAESAHVEVKAP